MFLRTVRIFPIWERGTYSVPYRNAAPEPEFRCLTRTASSGDACRGMRTFASPPQSLLAYEDPEFLAGADGRVLRILSEYLRPLAQFRRERVRDTVVFFGSARFHSREHAETMRGEKVELLQNQGSAEPAPPGEQPPSAEAALAMAAYYEDARRLAWMHTRWAQTLFGPAQGGFHRFVVCSGGGPGIMEAANRGASEAGGPSIGLNIRLPFEQMPNPYITPELSFDFHYFFMRKYWFAYLAKALVVFPGGFGTLDELFEILTLAQTGKLAKNITVILYGRDYWERVLNVEALIEAGAVSPRDRNLFTFADTPEAALAQLQASLTKFHLHEREEGRPEDLLPEIAHTRR